MKMSGERMPCSLLSAKHVAKKYRHSSTFLSQGTQFRRTNNRMLLESKTRRFGIYLKPNEYLSHDQVMVKDSISRYQTLLCCAEKFLTLLFHVFIIWISYNLLRILSKVGVSFYSLFSWFLRLGWNFSAEENIFSCLSHLWFESLKTHAGRLV